MGGSKSASSKPKRVSGGVYHGVASYRHPWVTCNHRSVEVEEASPWGKGIALRGKRLEIKGERRGLAIFLRKRGGEITCREGGSLLVNDFRLRT